MSSLFTRLFRRPIPAPAAKQGQPGQTTEAVGWGTLRTRPPTPHEMAKTYLGVKEIPGKAHNSLILRWLRRLLPSADADEISWCSAFMDAMAAAAGYEQARSLTARSWLKAGDPVKASEAQPGDVVIFWRESPTSWKGHVAFFERFEGSKVHVLGGNQSDAVTVAPYPRAQILGIRRLRRLPDAN